jgi:glyceraldehyde 3-phosphate dehydrogenase
MKKKVAINGMGRIGRATFKLLLESEKLEVVEINDLVSAENLAYLLKYDTVYGRWGKTVSADGDNLVVDGTHYRVIGEKDPARLPWGDLEIDIVFECTGLFTQKEDLEKHLAAGAKAVILSAPSKSPEVATVVGGVSPEGEKPAIISCASCTTNCIAPVMEILDRRLGIRKALMTTIHAYTSSQGLVDGPHKKPRRGRAGAANFVPTSTGAALATQKVLPQYEGKFDGVAVRGPIPTGSLADITALAARETTVEEVNRIFREEAATDRYRGVFGACDDLLVSSDIIADPRASIVDLGMTQVVDGDLIKVMSWYDNEWGYACQLVREAERMVSPE